MADVRTLQSRVRALEEENQSLQSLQSRVRALEEENRALRASLFSLTYGATTAPAGPGAGTTTTTTTSTTSNAGARRGGAADSSQAGSETGTGSDRSERMRGGDVPSSTTAVAAAATPITNTGGGPWTPWLALHGHSAAVYACKWAPCGARLASCSMDGSVRAWTPSFESEDGTGTGVGVLLGMHQRSATDVAFLFQSSSRVASSSLDKTVKLFDLASSVQLDSVAVDAFAMTTCAVTDEPNMVLAGLNNGVVMGLDFRTPKGLAGFVTMRGAEGSPSIHSVACASTNVFLTGDTSGMIKIWDRRRLVDHQSLTPVASVDVCSSTTTTPTPTPTPTPTVVIQGGTVTTMDMALRTVSSVAVQDGIVACASHDNILRVFHMASSDATRLELVHTHKSPTMRFSSFPVKVGMTHRSDKLFVACGNAHTSGGAHVFAIAGAKMKQAQALAGHHDGAVYDVSFALNVDNLDTYFALATCGADGMVRVYRKG